MDTIIKLLRERETIANHEASNYRRAIQCLEDAFLQGPAEPAPSKMTLVPCDKCDGQIMTLEFNGVTYSASHSCDCKPAPTPGAPDPGPGWRIRKFGEQITDGDQVLGYASRTWYPAKPPFGTVLGSIFRTPIYHNPANLETAGEGYRFLLVSEFERDATHWLGYSSWNQENIFANLLREDVTYRTNKPLPTT